MADATTVDQLGRGDHACLTFTDPDERLDLVADFVADGLHQGQRVVCFTDSVPADELLTELTFREIAAANALTDGQLSVRASHQMWLGAPAAAADHMIEVILSERRYAHEHGFTSVRITADMCWAARPVAAADQLVAFERQAAQLFDGGDLTVICQYDRELFDPVTLAFAAESHAKTVAAVAYHDTPLLRICRQHRPPGVRISGELDYTHLAPLQQALAEALRLDSTIHVNLAKLRFIDVTAATMIAKAALSMPPARQMIITCAPTVAEVFEAIGAAEASQMTLRRLP